MAFDPLDPTGMLGTLTGGDINFGATGMPWMFAGKGAAALGKNLPDLFAINSMLGFLGINPTEYLADYKVNKKAYKKDPLNVAKVGKNYYDIGALSAQKPELAKQAQTKALENAQAKYEELKQQPMLATLAAQAEGKFDNNFTTAVNDMFQQVVAKNLGAGAAQGFLNDPNKQAALTQPAAVAQAKYLQDYKQAAQGTLQGLAGLPQTTAFNPNLLAGPQSAAYYLPSVFNAAGMGQGTSQFNAQGGFNESQAKTAAFQDFFGTVAGAAAAGFGGGGGGGGGPIGYGMGYQGAGPYMGGWQPYWQGF